MNSLWKPGARAFFKDQRAQNKGDILTILVDFDEKANIENNTKRNRTSSQSVSVNSFLGLENKLQNLFPTGVDPSKLIGVTSTPSHEGKGSVSRKENLKMNIAAIITQVLPNGNLVIAGRQEVRVNFEIRELLITGIIRPQDITSNNTITSDKIAEARISYGGRGQISDMQQPTYTQQVVDALIPF